MSRLNNLPITGTAVHGLILLLLASAAGHAGGLPEVYRTNTRQPNPQETVAPQNDPTRSPERPVVGRAPTESVYPTTWKHTRLDEG